MRLIFCWPLLLLFSCFVSPLSAIESPNIVVILADDMGYGDLRAFNPESRISTPNLDAMAAAGMCFTDAHAGGSTCRPSRYALLTGRFAARKDSLSDKVPTIIDGRATIASMLRDNGYGTAMVGKWHLGFDRKGKRQTKRGTEFDYEKPITGGPVDRGFDTFFGMHASLDIPPYFYIRNRDATKPAKDSIAARDSVGGPDDWNQIQGAFWREGNIAEDFRHEQVTQRFADEACQVIRSHKVNKPLFLYLALPSPHTPWLPAERFIGKSNVGMYGDFVMTVDDVVGQVVTALEDAKLAENTLLLFSSDNGPVWYPKDVARFHHSSTGRLRGAKGSAWEGGHRVPFIVRWPGHVPAGTKNTYTVAFSDLFATLAEVAGQTSIPSGVAEDSESFLAAMLHTESVGERPSPILHGGKVIRSGKWKLINTKGSRGFGADKTKKYGVELYDLSKDVGETQNLARMMPQKVQELKDQLGSTLARLENSLVRFMPSPAKKESSLDSKREWREIFNGRDLTGWKANTRPESFSVVEGQLKAHGKNGMSHLFLVDDEGKDVVLKDFEFVATVRSEPNSNSGVFFHTDRELRSGKYLNKGYEVQLNSSKREKKKTGSLYGIVNLDASPVDETKWFEIRFLVQGKRIQVYVDRQKVVDYTEPDNPTRERNRAKRLIDPRGGALAIQAHDPKSVFYFKNIRIRER